jgi:hypothetical protein
VTKRAEKHAAKWQARKEKTAAAWKEEVRKHEDPHGGLQATQEKKPEEKK